MHFIALPMRSNSSLVDVSDIFFFFLLGDGEGGVRGAGGGRGIGFLLKSPGGGGSPGRGLGGCLQRIGELLGGGGV